MPPIEKPLSDSQDNCTVFKCDVCNATTIVEDAIVPVRKSLSRKTVNFCPDCLKKRTQRFNARILITALVFGLFGIALISFTPLYKLGWTSLRLFMLAAAYVILLILHEMGHVIAAKLMGLRIWSVIIGLGKQLWHFELGETDIIINAVPMSGCVRTASTTPHLYKARHIIFLSGGLAFNITALVITAILIKTHAAHHVLMQSVIWSVFMASLYSLLISFFITNGDLRKILSIYRMQKEEIEYNCAIRLGLSAYNYANRGQYDKALADAHKGLEKSPDSKLNRFALGYVLMQKGEFANCRQTLLPLIDRTDLKFNMRASTMNHIAFADLMLDELLLRKEALDFAEKACSLVGWDSFYRLTYALALIENEDVEAGMRIINTSLYPDWSKTNRREVLAALAWAN